MTELAQAIASNQPELVKQLLVRENWTSVQLNEPLSGLPFDQPAILAAAQTGNLATVDLLLAAGADINARSRWWAGGFGVLDFARREIAEALIERGAVVDIHAAARLGKLARVQELLNSDPSLVHARGGDGQLPLHFASSKEIVDYLLEHGADLDARDIDHESTAAQYMLPQRLELARYLIARGAQTDLLMLAALGDVELVRRHLEIHPDSVLLTVSEKSFPKKNERSGGCIYLYTLGRGRSPHLLAHEFGHEDVLRLLVQASPPWLQFAYACELGDGTLLQEDLAHVGDLPPEAYERLVTAASRNAAQAVERMLAAGWPVDAVGAYGQTALHWAAWHGNAALVEALIAGNAPLHVRETEHGGTPFDWAVHGQKQHRPDPARDYPRIMQCLQR